MNMKATCFAKFIIYIIHDLLFDYKKFEGFTCIYISRSDGVTCFLCNVNITVVMEKIIHVLYVKLCIYIYIYLKKKINSWHEKFV